MPIRAADPGDLDAVHTLLAARGTERSELEQSFALAGTDHLVAADPDVVGYGSLDSAQRIDVAATTAGGELLAALEARARARGFGRLSGVVAEGNTGFEALLRRSGFEHRGDVLRMWASIEREVPTPRWPDGVAVRAYSHGDARAVQALLDEAYAWDDTYAPRPHDDWLQWMTAHDEFDPELWLLVERDGELVACALHWREREGQGWLKDLAVREAERGRGLGWALVRAGFRAYAARDATRVGLKVDSSNPTGALQLYERVGFVTDQRSCIWAKEL